MTSQSNEDEIIAEIFATIGEGGRRFVEFGCGDGQQNNTIELLKRGWSGVWFEPHKRRCISAQDRWKGYPVVIERKVVTPERVNKLVLDPLDFLSIDIDGNDYAVWKACTAMPRVVCIEVDPINGTALEPMKALAESKGYLYDSPSASMVNAFFIRK